MTPDPSSDWITLACLIRPRGLKGEIVADGSLENPDRFRAFPNLRVLPSGGPIRVENVWVHQNRLVFKFAGVDTVEAAERFRGAELQIPCSDRPQAPEGSYYFDHLIGCAVVEGETEIGTVSDCLEFGGPVTLEVTTPGGGEILIPFVPAICLKTDIANKRITVQLPEGLKDL